MATGATRPPGLTDEQWAKQMELAEFARNCPVVTPKYGYAYPNTRPGVRGSHEKVEESGSPPNVIKLDEPGVAPSGVLKADMPEFVPSEELDRIRECLQAGSPLVADSKVEFVVGEVPVVETVFKGVIGDAAVDTNSATTQTFRLDCPAGQDFGKLEAPLLKVGGVWQDSIGKPVAAAMAKQIEKQLSLAAKGWKLVEVVS